MDWEDAKEWCKKQGEGWRLPSIIELLRAYYDDIDGFGSGGHWSATEYSEAYARSVYFSVGSVTLYFKTLNYSVRCVRDVS